MPTEAHWINIQRPRGLEDSAIPAEIAKVFVTGSMWLLLHQPQKPFRSVGFLIAEVFSVHAAWSTLLSRGGFTHVHKRVGVGTMITHGPRHRSGRAALPHPAPTLGHDAQALKGVRMTDTSRRKPPSNKSFHTVPRQAVALTSSSQDGPPEVPHCHAKGAQCRTVHGHSVIPKVTQQNRTQVRPLFRNGLVQALPQFTFNFSQLGLPPLPHRLPQHREVPLSGFPAAVREAQKVERLRFAVATGSPISFRIAAELDDPRFVGVQVQPELRQALAQFCQKPLCLRTILKAHDEVVSETDEDDIAVRSLLSPSLGPKVENIVQVEVRQQWANTPTLHGSYLTLYSLALF